MQQGKSPPPTYSSPPPAPSLLFSGLILLLNYVSSVALVILNKLLFQSYGYPFATVISLTHFLITELGLVVLAMLGRFQVKRIPLSALLVMSLLHAFTIPFCNMSIRFNSVGFHQIGKVMTIPLAAFYGRLFAGKRYPASVIASLFVICFGVVVTGITDINTTPTGVVFISLCVLTTVASQARITEVQNVRNVNPMQLLLLLTPLSSIVQLAAIPLVDNFDQSEDFWTRLLGYDYRPSFLVVLGLSAFAAFFVNYTGFLVLGLTSTVTYQVFGHFKTCTVLLGGFLLFQQPWDPLNLTGIAISLGGIFTYTYLTLKASGLVGGGASLGKKKK